MGHSFSEDLKWRMVYLYLDSYNKQKISKLLYTSYSGVCRILRNFKKWNCIENPFRGLSGHKKLFRSTDIKVLKGLVNEKVDWFLNELVEEMKMRTGSGIH
ncbi:12465_t:CDS:2 [Acaulospora morrowiae]|uniref:12465_t:CDS:1 n=1 Tax=Acaulospora morrowiae TaxID=94023 RepID=A0A9N8V8F8_9GLOM|nr:12465_t:CDS:2 [Acaulospora morrowiae]